MPRESLDDSLFEGQNELRQQLKRMAKKEKNRATGKVVHEIDSKSGNSVSQGSDSDVLPVWPKRKPRKPYRTWDWQWTKRHTQVCIGLVVFLSVGYLGNCGWAWWHHDSLVAEGEMLFKHEWIPNDPLSVSGDGLGPIFNANSCATCHFQGGVGGAGPNEHNVTNFVALPARERKELIAGVVHTQAVLPQFLETNDKLQQIYPIDKGRTVTRQGCTYRIPDFNPVQYATVSTPPLFGTGLIDTISTIAVEANFAKIGVNTVVGELQGDYEGPALGRLRILSGGRVGKFGWKAQFASLEEFVAAACAMECGLSNPLKDQIAPGEFAADQEAGWDMDRGMLTALVKFCEELPPPTQVLPTDSTELAKVERGEHLFSEIGCATCHTRDIGGVEGVYSDFLLHVVEDDYLDDTYTDPKDWGKHPLPGEWKTPPLWGVADSAPYWHDGSCGTLEQAIERHARQAKKVTASFKEMKLEDREAVIAFLETLKAPVLQQQPDAGSVLAVFGGK